MKLLMLSIPFTLLETPSSLPTDQFHSFGGMNVIHLETEQAVEHMRLMVSHLRKEDEVEPILQTSTNQLQIQAGGWFLLSWAVLSQPGKKTRRYMSTTVIQTLAGMQ
jgi:hypothetical protein